MYDDKDIGDAIPADQKANVLAIDRQETNTDKGNEYRSNTTASDKCGRLPTTRNTNVLAFSSCFHFYLSLGFCLVATLFPFPSLPIPWMHNAVVLTRSSLFQQLPFHQSSESALWPMNELVERSGLNDALIVQYSNLVSIPDCR